MVSSEDRRNAFQAWMKGMGLNPFSAARKAGVSPGTVYNFLSGVSDSLSAPVLQKMAEGTGSTVDAILGGGVDAAIFVTHRAGAGGQMFPVSDDEAGAIRLAPPPGASAQDRLAAALVDTESMLPIPAGWAIYFKQDPEAAAMLVGHMAVVRYAGGGERPVVATVRAGRGGLFSLQRFDGTMIEDVEVRAAHRIVAFAAPKAA